MWLDLQKTSFAFLRTLGFPLVPYGNGLLFRIATLENPEEKVQRIVTKRRVNGKVISEPEQMQEIWSGEVTSEEKV